VILVQRKLEDVVFVQVDCVLPHARGVTAMHIDGIEGDPDFILRSDGVLLKCIYGENDGSYNLSYVQQTLIFTDMHSKQWSRPQFQQAKYYELSPLTYSKWSWDHHSHQLRQLVEYMGECVRDYVAVGPGDGSGQLISFFPVSCCGDLVPCHPQVQKETFRQTLDRAEKYYVEKKKNDCFELC